MFYSTIFKWQVQIIASFSKCGLILRIVQKNRIISELCYFRHVPRNSVSPGLLENWQETSQKKTDQ